MARLARKTQKIFCGDAIVNDNVAQFGSLKNQNPIFSSDPDVIQGLDAYGLGWKSAVLDNQAPALQDVNALQYLFSRQLAYLMQAGIPEYDAATTYYAGQICADDAGVLYRSRTNGNVGNALTVADHWVKQGANGPGAVPIGGVIATFPNLAGAYACTATTVADADGYVKCGGQTLSDASSPMNGRVIPNVNNDVFLMGATTAGTAGGVNSYIFPDHFHALSSNGRALIGVPGSTFLRYSSTYDPTLFTTATKKIPISGVSSETDPSCLGTDLYGRTDGITGSITEIENRPKYISAVYVMRVK